MRSQNLISRLATAFCVFWLTGATTAWAVSIPVTFYLSGSDSDRLHVTVDAGTLWLVEQCRRRCGLSERHVGHFVQPDDLRGHDHQPDVQLRPARARSPSTT